MTEQDILAQDILDITIPDDRDRFVLCGGPYSNFGAVEAFLAQTEGVDYRFCLGDIGGFGPLPDRTIQHLRRAAVICLQGNYDYAIGAGERDCGCGYTDPRDQRFAQISYDYTYAHTSEVHRQWLSALPKWILLRWRDRRFLLCHGSPAVVNEFVWESETSDEWIETTLTQMDVSGIFATHTGLPWVRFVERGFWCNVGVLGRPAHEGQRHVYFAEVRFPPDGSGPMPRLVPLAYDPHPVVTAMAAEGLPEEFQAALLTGIWTTCAESLPPAERDVRSRIPNAPCPEPFFLPT